MICKRAAYVNFRNISRQTLEFDEGINIIFGDNAQGKTSALEGIYLCAQGRSHRSSKEKDFIKFGSGHASISIEYSSEKRDLSRLEIRYSDNGRKYCAKNGVPVGRMSEFIGNFRAIIFTPEHLSIVKEGPSNRRFFVDSALSQISPVYVSYLQSYYKNLIQRNKLLQNYENDRYTFDQTIELWSENLAVLGEKISRERYEYIKKLENVTDEIYSDMTSGKEKITLRYKEPRSADDLRKLLFENLDKEKKYRTTLYGIQKDDIDIEINGMSAREFGSQGQQRSAALAMKLGEGEISKEVGGEYPVFLFDDILSELDSSRRDYIMQGIKNKQVIITTCERDVSISGAKSFECVNGEFRSY